MKSSDARFIECKGVGPGFDHLRIGLSLAILFWHSFGVAHGLAGTLALDLHEVVDVTGEGVTLSTIM